MANEAAILLLCLALYSIRKRRVRRSGEALQRALTSKCERQICTADLCYCDQVFVAEERASEKDDVGKAQESYVLL